MRRALAETGLPEPVCTYLDGPFTRIAHAFQNR
jgi:truncated hemoglobin YjbI